MRTSAAADDGVWPLALFASGKLSDEVVVMVPEDEGVELDAEEVLIADEEGYSSR